MKKEIHINKANFKNEGEKFWVVEYNEGGIGTPLYNVNDDIKWFINQNLKEILKIISETKNPYPKDIFLWNNKEKLNFNRGRFNKFTYEVVENIKEQIIKELKENYEE